MPRPPDTSPSLAVFRELLDRSGDGLVALDADGKVIEANTAAAVRLGRPREYLVGKPFAVFVGLSARADFRAALRNATAEPLDLEVRLEDGGSVALSLRCLVADGRRLIAMTVRNEGEEPPPPPPPRPRAAFDLSAFLLRLPQAVISFDRRGRVVLANHPARRLLGTAAIRVGAPLSETGIAGEIRALADRLAVMRAPLPPRTVELPDGRVLRASGTPAHDDEPAILQLEDMTREWQEDHRNREFVRNAAHQLRTPLAAITSAIDVLESGGKGEPETLDRFLAHIRTHADRLTRLTRGLLVLARIEAGESPRLDFVELHPLLHGLAGEAERPVAVRCPDSLAALADIDLLHEALNALLDNAIKHAPDGEIVLTAENGAESVSVSVVDSGPGVLPEHRARILEPFFRAGAQGDGFGLGLAIASRAVAAMGGQLLVEPTDSGGQFTVLLRAATVVR